MAMAPTLGTDRRLTAVIVAVLAMILAVGAANSEMVARVFFPFAVKSNAMLATGTLTGQVRIGPLCPVEPCPVPTPNVYSSRKLLLRREDGQPAEIPLRSDGAFRAEVAAGVYEVRLSDCTYLGCRGAFPKTVTVEPGKVTTLEIDIDTGIR